MTDMKHTEQEYVTFDPFFGDEAEITCRTVKLVKVRKSHACFFGAGSGDGHTIAPGDYARYEKALVDGSYWGRYYLCIPCLNREIAGMHGDDDDDLEGDNG